jgi:hypothetical protein
VAKKMQLGLPAIRDQFRTRAGLSTPVVDEPVPDESWRKTDIVEWLGEREIAHASTDTKADLLALVSTASG